MSRNRSMSVCGVIKSDPKTLPIVTQSKQCQQLQSNEDTFLPTSSDSVNLLEEVSERRESLVKPTWQNIRPGQISVKTLEKINGISSDSDNDDSQPEQIRRLSIQARQSAQLQRENKNKNSPRKCSSGNLGQLTRKGSLVMHRDSLSHAIPADNETSQSSTHKNAVPNEGGAPVCRNAGLKLIRIISRKCGNHSQVLKQKLCDEILAKNKVVLVDGTRVKLQIWDTAGQERFRSVTHAYYRDAHALLLLYDVTNKVTYDNIRAWLCEIRDCAQENVVIVLIGNKADCSNSDRQIKREDGERLAREHNVPFMETSAKTGQNVELAFETVARQLKSRGYENGDEGKFNVHEFVRDNTKAKSVCAQCNF
ncbi:RAS oncogene family member Rab26 isoform 3-T4 [Glossina fuscipes fuscipes]